MSTTTVYVQPTEIIIRANPSLSSAVVARVPINSELTLGDFARLDGRGNMWVDVRSPVNGFAIAHNQRNGNVYLSVKKNVKWIVPDKPNYIGKWAVDGHMFVTPDGNVLPQLVGAYISNYGGSAITNGFELFGKDLELMASIGMKVVGFDAYLPSLTINEAIATIGNFLDLIKSKGMYAILTVGGLQTLVGLDEDGELSPYHTYIQTVISHVANHPSVLAIQTPYMQRITPEMTPTMTEARAAAAAHKGIIDTIRESNPQAIVIPGWANFSDTVPQNFLRESWFQIMYRMSFYASFHVDFIDNTDDIYNDLRHASVRHMPAIVSVQLDYDKPDVISKLRNALTRSMMQSVAVTMCPILSHRPAIAYQSDGQGNVIDYALSPSSPNYDAAVTVWGELVESIAQGFNPNF